MVEGGSSWFGGVVFVRLIGVSNLAGEGLERLVECSAFLLGEEGAIEGFARRYNEIDNVLPDCATGGFKFSNPRLGCLALLLFSARVVNERLHELSTIFAYSLTKADKFTS